MGWVSASRSVCFRCPFVLLLTSNWKNAHAPKATFSFPYELSEQIQMVQMLQNLMRVMPVEHNGRLSGLIVSISHRWTPDRVRKIKSGLSLLAKCGKHQENTQGNMCCCFSDLEGRIQVGVWRLCHNLRMMWEKKQSKLHHNRTHLDCWRVLFCRMHYLHHYFACFHQHVMFILFPLVPLSGRCKQKLRFHSP